MEALVRAFHPVQSSGTQIILPMVVTKSSMNPRLKNSSTDKIRMNQLLPFGRIRTAGNSLWIM